MKWLKRMFIKLYDRMMAHELYLELHKVRLEAEKFRHQAWIRDHEIIGYKIKVMNLEKKLDAIINGGGE